MISLDSWLTFLRHSHSAVGFPLVVGGLALMFFGWRMWKLCVVVSFGLIGAGVAAWLVGPCDSQWIYALAGGVVLGLASYWPANLAIALLGGLIGGAIVTACLAEIGLKGNALHVSGIASVVACTGYAVLARQQIVIVVTSFLGSVLLMSGLATWVMAMPGLYGTLQNMASSNIIVLPFLLLVPTVMSSFFQNAELRRLNSAI